MIKALFFDMDGTLVAYYPDGHGEIPMTSRKLLDELRKKGVMIFAATGRGRSEMETSPLFANMPFDAVLAMNGQYCYTEKEDLRVSAINSDDLAGFMECQKEKPFPCIFMEKYRDYGNMDTPEFRAALAKICSEPPKSENIDDLAEREILQIVPYISEKELDHVKAKMPHSKATRWSPEFVDIVDVNGGKGRAIELILKTFKLSADEIMAFGDGENDIEMVKMAKIGVAMGNAADELKRFADYIADDADKDGVAKALDHFIAEGVFES